MPSHKIHIAIAQEINKKLKMDNDEISLGSILPDLAIVIHHGISHFQYVNEYPQNLANPDEFIRIYKEELNNVISIGYLIHLLTDRFYNECYFRKFYIFENDKPIKFIFNNQVITDNNFRREMKHHDFNEYDKYLIDKNIIIPFKDKNVILKIPKYKDLSFDLNFLSKYLDKSNNELKNKYLKYEFLGWKKEELDEIYDKCILYIFNYLKEKLNMNF